MKPMLLEQIYYSRLFFSNYKVCAKILYYVNAVQMPAVQMPKLIFIKFPNFL